jgi:hypothetical protein
MSNDEGMKNIGPHHSLSGRQKNPDWAAGLRRLYDSVVEEPLPDSFAKLLDKLDDGNA